RPQPFLEVDEATLDLLLGLNVRAAFIVAQAAARLMVAPNGRKGGGGVIINMSSQMGHVGSDLNRTVYVMTKHAVEGLTKAMAAGPLGDRMRRRGLILGLCATIALPLPVRAQKKAMPTIGYMSGGSASFYAAGILPAFRDGLREAGYVEGENVTIDYRWAEG